MQAVVRDDNSGLAIAARAAVIICAILVTGASFCPPAWLPQLFYSNNLEHFAAFYIVALGFCAARYRAPLVRVLRDVAIFATVLEAVRLIYPGPRPANFDHWVADLGGILAAAAPMLVSKFRWSFRPRLPTTVAPDV